MKMRFFVSLALLFMQGSQLILTYAEDASITLLSQNDPLISLDHSFRKEKIDQAIIREARKNAEEYIQSLESDDRFWKGQNPKLLGNPAPYYTDDTSEPLVYEWKVRCDNTRDCGSVMVATLNGEYRIVEAGTYGTANYERLAEGKEKNKNTLYYYSPFDKYIESENDIQIFVGAINPNIDKLSMSQKQKYLTDLKKIKIPKEEGLFKIGDQLNEKSATLKTLGSPTIVNVLPMPPEGTCQSNVPCYTQYSQWYGQQVCAVGCAPLAMSIIFGYYDRVPFNGGYGLFPNLIPGVASGLNVDTSMANSIRSYMGTYCNSNGQGVTYDTSIKYGMAYARDRGYTNSQNGIYTYGGGSFLFPKIRNEINAARPLIGFFKNPTTGEGHFVPIYGYNDTGNIVTTQVHINFGWGPGTPDAYVSVYSAIPANDLAGYKLTSIITVPVSY